MKQKKKLEELRVKSFITEIRNTKAGKFEQDQTIIIITPEPTPATHCYYCPPDLTIDDWVL